MHACMCASDVAINSRHRYKSVHISSITTCLHRYLPGPGGIIERGDYPQQWRNFTKQWCQHHAHWVRAPEAWCHTWIKCVVIVVIPQCDVRLRDSFQYHDPCLLLRVTVSFFWKYILLIGCVGSVILKSVWRCCDDGATVCECELNDKWNYSFVFQVMLLRVMYYVAYCTPWSHCCWWCDQCSHRFKIRNLSFTCRYDKPKVTNRKRARLLDRLALLY